MIKEIEFYYGAAIARMLRNSNRGLNIKQFESNSSCSFVVENSVGLFIKYCANRMSPWRFTFLKDQQDEFARLRAAHADAYLILVCETDGIVALDFAEVKTLLDEVHDETEWISVARRKRQQYTVKGSDGELSFKIADSDFPKKLIDRLSKLNVISA